jgi:hypothetical protein
MKRRLPMMRYFVVLAVLAAFEASGQPGSGSGGPPGGGGPPPTPISGIEFLLGAGCLVGIKRSISFLKGLRKSS